MDNKTIATYNRLAQGYDDETADFWEKFPRTFLDQFVSLSGTTILDVGSGPGRDGLLLQEAGKEVMCLDASEEMVKLSSERGLPSVVGDFMGLPFPDAAFDGVWAYTSLLHVPKAVVGSAFEEVVRVLKDGGMLGLGFIGGGQELYRENLGEGNPRWFSYYMKEEVERLVERQGCEPVYFESFPAGKSGSKDYLNFIFRKVMKSDQS
ncbi:MAG TPA: class I SAM-dependent methyltransferase [Candidatus Paceibacterota bacterium]|nr:class I SAM-dependent methyltransferase [Candidatus Paceibacterota bacterium]